MSAGMTGPQPLQQVSFVLSVNIRSDETQTLQKESRDSLKTLNSPYIFWQHSSCAVTAWYGLIDLVFLIRLWSVNKSQYQLTWMIIFMRFLYQYIFDVYSFLLLRAEVDTQSFHNKGVNSRKSKLNDKVSDWTGVTWCCVFTCMFHDFFIPAVEPVTVIIGLAHDSLCKYF